MLDENFLKQIAIKHSLTPIEVDTFIARFSEKNWKKTELNIAMEFNIAEDTIKKRLKEIYTKMSPSCFELECNSKGKFEILRTWLLKEYQRIEEAKISNNEIHKEYITDDKPNQVNDYTNSEIQLDIINLKSTPYIERPPIENECFKNIIEDGALIRVKAPHLMGKTLLMNKILANTIKHNYKTVIISFEIPDSTVLTNIHKFSQWFCATVGKKLGIPNKLNNYWDDIFGCNDNINTYFEEYLIVECRSPVLLALDKLDRVFEQPEIADDFCRLLRGWNDMAKRSDKTGYIWRKLRLMLLHSTEAYTSLDINYSPLANIGKVIPLPEFITEQVEDLAKLYQLDWLGTSEIEQLMAMVGGHPYLLTQAFDYLQSQKVKLSELLQIAPTEKSPFSNHLRKQLWTLEQNSELATALAEVVNTNLPIRLKQIQAFKLESMGLIKLQNDDCSPRCNLYRQYFSTNLLNK